MIKALNAAESDYRSTNPFELKSCLGHIRSFLEHLHRELRPNLRWLFVSGYTGDLVALRGGVIPEATFLRSRSLEARCSTRFARPCTESHKTAVAKALTACMAIAANSSGLCPTPVVSITTARAPKDVTTGSTRFARTGKGRRQRSN